MLGKILQRQHSRCPHHHIPSLLQFSKVGASANRYKICTCNKNLVGTGQLGSLQSSEGPAEVLRHEMGAQHGCIGMAGEPYQQVLLGLSETRRRRWPSLTLQLGAEAHGLTLTRQQHLSEGEDAHRSR